MSFIGFPFSVHLFICPVKSSGLSQIFNTYYPVTRAKSIFFKFLARKKLAKVFASSKFWRTSYQTQCFNQNFVDWHIRQSHTQLISARHTTQQNSSRANLPSMDRHPYDHFHGFRVLLNLGFLVALLSLTSLFAIEADRSIPATEDSFANAICSCCQWPALDPGYGS